MRMHRLSSFLLAISATPLAAQAGSLTLWGDNANGQCNQPYLTNVKQVALGGWHTLAVRSDGSVLAWGFNGAGQCSVPGSLSDVRMVAAGLKHSVAVRNNGTVSAWGDDTSSQSTVPSSLNPVISIAAGDAHTLALLTDGSLRGWGASSDNRRNLQAGSNYTQVAAGKLHSAARRANGTVTACGPTEQSTLPEGLSDVTHIACGTYHTLALLGDGTVKAWGASDAGAATQVPETVTNVRRIAAGGYHNLVLKMDGTVAAWGDNEFGQTTVPALSGTTRIAAGLGHSVALATDALTAPTDVSASDGASLSGVTITWSEAPSATSYKVFRSLPPGSPVLIGTSPDTSLTDISAQPGVAYAYQVQTVDFEGLESPASTPDGGWRGLPAPTGVAASDGLPADGVVIVWNAVPGAASYRVTRSINGGEASVLTTLASSEPRTFKDTTIAFGTVASYRVNAEGGAGTGSGPSSTADAGWRGALPPSGTSATDGTRLTDVQVTWGTVAGATDYQVFRSDSLTALATVKASPYLDTNATPGQVYTYSVRAVLPTGTTASGATDTGYRGLSAPTGVSAGKGASTSAIAVAWNAVTGATAYKVFRNGALAGTVSAPALTFSDSQPAPAAACAYTVRAVGGIGTDDGPVSAADSGYRALAAPSGLKASDGTDSTGVSVSWNAVTSATSYKVFRNATLVGTVTAPTVSYLDTGISSASTATYTAKAVAAVTGFGNTESAASAGDSGYRGLVAPSGVAASNGTSVSSVTITWSACEGAASYKIYRANEGASPAEIGSVNAPALTFADSGGIMGRLYAYSVRAVGATGTGEGPLSAADDGWRKLAAPTDISATDGTRVDDVRLTWSIVSGATAYKVFRNGAATPLATVSSPPYLDTSASPGTKYTYVVRASAATGDSDAGTGNEGYRGLAAPTGLAASDGTNASGVALSWNAVTGAVSYKVLRNGTLIASTEATSYLDTTAPMGVSCTYTIKAVGAAGIADGDSSDADEGWFGVASTASMSASDGTSEAAVTITWTAVPNAVKYQVLRAASSQQTPTLLATVDAPALSSSDATGAPGTRFTYSVRAVSALNVVGSPATDTGYRGLSAPTGVSAGKGASTSAIAVAWNAVTGATAYKVFRNGALAGTVSAPALTFSDSQPAPAAACAYTVRAVGGIGTDDGPVSAADSGYRALAAPSGLKASDGTDSTGVSVSWNAVTSATSYKVFRNATLVGTVTAPTVSYLDTGISSASTATYTAKAVAAVTGFGNTESAASAGDSGYRGLVAPSGVAASNGTSVSSVTITWSACEGAASYKIYRANEGASPAEIGSVNAPALTFADSGGIMGRLYAYSVRAVGATGTGEGPLSAADDGWRKLAAPTDISATDGTRVDDVRLTWSIVSGATAYKVFRNGAATPLATVSSPPYLDTSASPGTKYTYVVRASAATGDSDAGTGNEGYRGLAAPTGLAASDGTNASGVALSWNAVTGAVSYKVLRNGTLIASTEATSYLDTTAPMGVSCTYTIKAVGAEGIADGGTAADTGWRGLTAPLAVAASDGSGTSGVTISWNASTGAGSYRVMRAQAPAAAVAIANVTAPTTSYVDTSAVAGTLYAYSIIALGPSGVGQSNPSAADDGWRALPAPTTTAATDGTSTASVTVSWSAVAGASGGYRVYRGTAGSLSPLADVPSGVRSFVDTSIAPGAPLQYAVSAIGGTGTGEGPRSAGDLGHRALGAPSGVAASDGTSASKISVAWSTTPGATAYRVYRNGALITATPIAGNAYDDTTAVAGTRYTYGVRATGVAGVSDSALSLGDAGWRNLPSPGGFTATASTTKIALSWSAVSGATGYAVYRGTSPDSMASITLTITGTTANDTTAAPGVTYHYGVRARCAQGLSDLSNVQQATRPSSLSGGSMPSLGGGADGSKAGGGPGPDDGDAAVELAPMGIERYLQVIAISPDAAVSCAGDTDETTHDAPSPEDGSQVSFIDLDGNLEPDLCQLRAGDLDLNGTIDHGDIAALLTMIGSEPQLGIGDLDGDGVIDAADIAALSARVLKQD